MNRREILVDVGLCYGCFACEVACKQEHNLPVGPRWMRVHKVGPKTVNGKVNMYFYPMHCRHCSKPACVEACPKDAIIQNTDGVVLVSEERCIGCLRCMETCPFGAIEYNPETGLVGQCNLCVERIERGKLPTCVQHCPTGALQFGAPNELMVEKQKAAAQEESGFKV
ncbi:4Fe-4S dicluster domain-containing protein [Chloroflexota bacterium]